MKLDQNLPTGAVMRTMSADTNYITEYPGTTAAAAVITLWIVATWWAWVTRPRKRNESTRTVFPPPVVEPAPRLPKAKALRRKP